MKISKQRIAWLRPQSITENKKALAEYLRDLPAGKLAKLARTVCDEKLEKLDGQIEQTKDREKVNELQAQLKPMRKLFQAIENELERRQDSLDKIIDAIESVEDELYH